MPMSFALGARAFRTRRKDEDTTSTTFYAHAFGARLYLANAVEIRTGLDDKTAQEPFALDASNETPDIGTIMQRRQV